MNMKTQVEDRLSEYSKDKSNSSSQEIDSKFIMKCLNDNVAGDAAIFKRLFAKDFCFNKSSGGWMYWTGSHWTNDKMDYALSSVSEVAKVYASEISKLSKEIKELDDDESI